jgi:hypothetical protein
MQSYPRNSPQAAARIVALAALADGHLCRTELDVLDQHFAYQQLGLTRSELLAVVNTLCEELLAPTSLNWLDVCCVDTRTLQQLLDEIDDPDLRIKVLSLCIALIEANGHVAQGEAIVVGAMVEGWGLHRWMFQFNLDTYQRALYG